MDYGLKYIKSKTIKLKLLDENIGENIYCLGQAKLSQIHHQKHNPQKKKLINQTSSKFKTSVKDTLKRIKRKATDQKKIFANYIFTKDLIIKYL